MSKYLTKDARGRTWRQLPETQAAALGVLRSKREVTSQDRTVLRRHVNRRTAQVLVDLGLAQWDKPGDGQRWRITQAPMKRSTKNPRFAVEVVARVLVHQ